MRSFAVLATLLVLSACDAPNLEQTGQDLAAIGGQAVEAASGAVDTRTACMIAGQQRRLCGCVQDRFARITREHVEDITGVVAEAAQSGSIEGAANSAENIDPATRDACVARRTLQSKVR